MALLLFYLAIAIGVSFLCSLLEASLLSIPRSHIAVMTERGSRAGQGLQVMKDDVDRPLAAILTLNTFAHTLGAAGVGAQSAVIWGEAWVGVVGVVVTLAILIFSEIIPKTLGAVHAKRLASFTAWTVHWMILILYPVVAACDRISKLLAGRNTHAPIISREEMHSLAQLAHEEGAIDRNEARILRNLIALREATVEQVMTPRTVAFTLPAGQTVGQTMSAEPPRFARVPITGDSIDDIRGLVHRHALFTAMAEGRQDATLEEIARPAHIVPESAKLSTVLQQFIDRREHLFIVVDEYGSKVGIVTLEDVLETLLGVEIVDETDSVEDMQKLAKQLLNSRREPRTQ